MGWNKAFEGLIVFRWIFGRSVWFRLRPIRPPGFLEVVPSLKPLDVMHQEAEVGGSSTWSSVKMFFFFQSKAYQFFWGNVGMSWICELQILILVKSFWGRRYLGISCMVGLVGISCAKLLDCSWSRGCQRNSGALPVEYDRPEHCPRTGWYL